MQSSTHQSGFKVKLSVSAGVQDSGFTNKKCSSRFLDLHGWQPDGTSAFLLWDKREISLLPTLATDVGKKFLATSAPPDDQSLLRNQGRLSKFSQMCVEAC